MAIGFQGKSDEEKYQDAEKYMHMVLSILPGLFKGWLTI